ncbi:hypothetical protein C2W62_15145 [Candidatus Entotheonella serta]|nr:hypothetical protein C2W62_15145 [Candidatus Entotheonella serta]
MTQILKDMRGDARLDDFAPPSCYACMQIGVLMGFDKREKDAMAVAYLASQGILQEEIKTALNLSSQTEVSRLLSLAKKEGWLRWELNLPPEVDESEVLLRTFTRQEELKQRLGDLARINSGRPVTDIRVVYSSEKDTMEQLIYTIWTTRG